MPSIVLPRLEGLADSNPELYEILRELRDQLNQTLPFILSGNDHPDPTAPSAQVGGKTSNVKAAPGALYIQRNSLSGPLAIHVKDTGFDSSGWAELGAFGSIPPTSAGGFQAVAQPTQITFFFDGTNGSQIITLFKANGDQVQIPAGNVVVTGLVANTTYFFYPYYDERSKSLQFVSGTVGNPAIAATIDNSNSAQLARLAHRIPLTAGSPVTVTTPNSGSSPSSVGGGFGSGGKGRVA